MELPQQRLQIVMASPGSEQPGLAASCSFGAPGRGSTEITRHRSARLALPGQNARKRLQASICLDYYVAVGLGNVGGTDGTTSGCGCQVLSTKASD